MCFRTIINSDRKLRVSTNDTMIFGAAAGIEVAIPSVPNLVHSVLA